MSAIDVLLAAMGTLVTVLTVAGMILLTPRGVVEVHTESDPDGSNLSPVPDVTREERTPALGP
jgi:hypothetical protein